MSDAGARDSKGLREGAGIRRQEISSHVLPATQTQFSHLHATSRRPKAQATQNMKSHAARMSGAVARAFRGIWESRGLDKEPESGFPPLAHAPDLRHASPCYRQGA